MNGLLVIVPCGKAKVWDKQPQLGPTPAKDAYTGPPFKVNKAYAKKFGSAWVILSAKYGFVRPDDLIPGPYNVTFSDPRTNPISIEKLRDQIDELALGSFLTVLVGWSGQDYRDVVEAAFRGMAVQPGFPFAGLSLFHGPHQVKVSTTSGHPIPSFRQK